MGLGLRLPLPQRQPSPGAASGRRGGEPLDAALQLHDVRSHARPGPLGVVGGDGVDDLPVRGDDVHAVVVGQREPRHAETDFEVQQSVREHGVNRVSSGERDLAVEGDVEHAGTAAVGCALGALVDERVQRLDVDVGRPQRGQSRDVRLDAEPRLRELGHRHAGQSEEGVEIATQEVGIHAAHEVAAHGAVTDADQPPVLQDPQRLAQRHAAGPELPHQLPLGRQLVAALEPPFEDRPLDLGDDVLVHAGHADRGEHRRGTMSDPNATQVKRPARRADARGRRPTRRRSGARYNDGAMTKRERIAAALRAKPVDRPPISFWRHAPAIDHDPRLLAETVLAFHRRFDLDLIKVMSSGVYGVEDWGCKVAYRGAPSGAKVCVKHAVRTTADWARIKPLDPGAGALGRELETVRLIARGRPDDAPILHTLFSPLTLARKLAGDLLTTDLRARPESVLPALEAITDTVARYAMASLEAGADGVFFATQTSTPETLTAEESGRYDVPFARRALEPIASRSFFTLLHLHGRDPYFDQVLGGLTVHGVNWHDRLTKPSLAEARTRFGGALVGGLNERGTLATGPPAAVTAAVADACRQTAGRALIVGPGCVVPLAAPEASLQAAVDAVKLSRP
jgi:uroporphyrinogen decarboxylase